jgi:fucose permease
MQSIKVKVRESLCTPHVAHTSSLRESSPLSPNPPIASDTSFIIRHHKSEIPLTASPANTQTTVIEAYSLSLRIVFISAIAMFAIVNILVFAIKLPHLKRKKAEDLEDESGGVNEGGT